MTSGLCRSEVIKTERKLGALCRPPPSPDSSRPTPPLTLPTPAQLAQEALHSSVIAAQSRHGGPLPAPIRSICHFGAFAQAFAVQNTSGHVRLALGWTQ